MMNGHSNNCLGNVWMRISHSTAQLIDYTYSSKHFTNQLAIPIAKFVGK